MGRDKSLDSRCHGDKGQNDSEEHGSQALGLGSRIPFAVPFPEEGPGQGEGFPAASQTRTRQARRWPEESAGPRYGRKAVWAEATRPVSQMSAVPWFSEPLEEAT